MKQELVVFVFSFSIRIRKWRSNSKSSNTSTHIKQLHWVVQQTITVSRPTLEQLDDSLHLWLVATTKIKQRFNCSLGVFLPLVVCCLTSRCCARVGWLTVICLFLCIFLCHMMLRHIFFPLYFVINSVYKKRQRENNFSPKIQDKTKVIFFSLCFFIVFDIFKQACVNNVLCACYTSAYYGFIEILPRM